MVTVSILLMRKGNVMSQLNDLLETVPCDLCGYQNEEFLYTKQGVLTKHPFRVVRCRTCGLIYLNPRLADKSIIELYGDSYYEGKGFDSNVKHIMDINQENDSDKGFRPEETVGIIKEIAPPPCMFLDYGCGIGDLVTQAVKHGYRAEGFEVSQFAADYAMSNGLKVYTNIDDLPSERYDIVTAIEVLEHCSSPMKALSQIYKSLKPGGCLYYTTANFDGFYRKWKQGVTDSTIKSSSFGALDGYILPEGHIYFFSTSVMKSYFNKIGFSRVFPFEPKAYQQGRLYKFLESYRLINTNTTAACPVTLLEKVLYYSLRYIATYFGIRQRPLPLARK